MGLLTLINKTKREHKEQRPITQTLRVEQDAVLYHVYPDEQEDFMSRYAYVGTGEDGIPMFRLRSK